MHSKGSKDVCHYIFFKLDFFLGLKRDLTGKLPPIFDSTDAPEELCNENDEVTSAKMSATNPPPAITPTSVQAAKTTVSQTRVDSGTTRTSSSSSYEESQSQATTEDLHPTVEKQVQSTQTPKQEDTERKEDSSPHESSKIVVPSTMSRPLASSTASSATQTFQSVSSEPTSDQEATMQTFASSIASSDLSTDGSTSLDPTPLEFPSSSDHGTSSVTQTMPSEIKPSSASHFLGLKASRQPFVRPETLPRSAPANLQAVSKPKVEQPAKRARQSDMDPEPALPNMNDILNGLLNVVGEGLSIATNYVKEENKRKAEAASKLSESSTTKTTAVPAVRPSRINNRGPPRFTEIPFEAIPLEVLNSQRPGQKPVQIKQRPFQTRFKIPKPSQVRPPVYATGIPLPELLIPQGELKETTTADPPKQTEDQTVDKKETRPKPVDKLQNAYVVPSNNGPVALSGSNNMAVNFPGKGENFENLLGEMEKVEKPKLPSVTVAILPSTTRVILPIQNTKSTTQRPVRIPFIPTSLPPIRKPPTRRPVVSGTTPRLPTNRPSFRPGIVVDPPRDVVTGKPVRVPGNADVFDLTVTAFQGYGNGQGSGGGPIRIPGLPIITKAQPGDEFVSIDGKRTYFDIGPTVNPFANPVGVPKQPDCEYLLLSVQMSLLKS